jgi:Patatin-like phospholipase
MTVRNTAADGEANLSRRSEAASRRAVPKPARGKARHLSLALQGGGSLGAFTWGVLDRLLEEENLTFDAISGASAGAGNAPSSLRPVSWLAASLKPAVAWTTSGSG